MTQRGLSILAAALVVVSCVGFGCARKTDETVVQLRDRVKAVSDPARRFYEARGFVPVWTDEQNRRSLLAALPAATGHGLDPKAYGIDRLRSFDLSDEPSTDPSVVATRDLAFTQAFLGYAAHLANGRVQAGKDVPEPDLGVVLEQALANRDVENRLEGLAPRQPGYRALREALVKYRAIADAGDWPELPGPTASGDLLSKRLAAEGVADLRAFQIRRGLKPGGQLESDTLRVLAVPASARVKQIEANLERWRRLPHDLGIRYVWVNLADFTLAAYDSGTRVLEMKVIIGSQYNPTPIFSDRMAYLIFNPYWLIPPSIARDEILPKGREYMEREGIKTDSQGRLRQEPGPRNPLGRVKFMFPNQFNVYLHDTSSAELFDRQNRTLSHGCVRVEKPVELAEFVLGSGGGWSRQQILDAIESGKNRRANLAEPVPVYILYWTAWVDADGTVEFRDDVYGYDQATLADSTVTTTDPRPAGARERGA